MFVGTQNGASGFFGDDDDSDDETRNQQKHNTGGGGVGLMGGGFGMLGGSDEEDDSDVDRPPLSEADVRKRANKQRSKVKKPRSPEELEAFRRINE